jgi:hypothetical protein
MNVRRTIPPEAGQPSQACSGRNVFIKWILKNPEKKKKKKKKEDAGQSLIQILW